MAGSWWAVPTLLGVLLQEGNRGGPGFLGGFGVGFVLRLSAQEAVAGAFVNVRVVSLVEFGHVFLGGGNGGVHAGVVAAVVALHGGLDPLVVGGIGRRGAVV